MRITDHEYLISLSCMTLYGTRNNSSFGILTGDETAVRHFLGLADSHRAVEIAVFQPEVCGFVFFNSHSNSGLGGL